MPVACIDTSMTTPLVAVLGDHPDDDRGTRIEGRAQGILAALDGLLGGDAPSTISAVVVGVGPGGFTGLRVGVATARGIAETLGVPLTPVPSLAIVAEAGAPAHRDGTFWATLDARRGEWFAQQFELDPDGTPVPTTDVMVVPDDRLQEQLGATPRVDAAHVDASALARTARRAMAGPSGVVGGNPLVVVPDYGREPDATPPRLETVIAPLGPGDLDAVLSLESRCFQTPWTRGMYVEELARDVSVAVRLGARDATANDRLVGAALAARIGDHWHVMNVLVDPIARRRGIASRLLVEVLGRTAALGAGDGWTLEVREGNQAAIGLYRGHGFTEVGRRPGYYPDTGEDAIVMLRGSEEATP